MFLIISTTVIVLTIIIFFWVIGKLREFEYDESEEETSSGLFTSPDVKGWTAEQADPQHYKIQTLQKRINNLESQISAFNNVFNSWKSEKEKLAEQIELSGIKQEMQQFGRGTASLVKFINDQRENSMKVFSEYENMKDLVADVTNNQLSVLPTQIQPLIAEYQHVNETVTAAQERFVLRLKEKDEAFNILLQRYKGFAKEQNVELSDGNQALNNLKSELRTGLQQLNKTISEYVSFSSEQISKYNNEINSIKDKKVDFVNLLENDRESGRERIGDLRQVLNNEIELLKQGLRNQESQNELLLDRKEEEIFELNAQIIEADSKLQGRRNQFQKTTEIFKRRVNYKMRLAEERHKALEEEQNEIISIKKQDFEKLSEELNNAERKLREEVNKELNAYKEEEKSLLKARDEYQNRLVADRDNFQKRNADYETEVSYLRQRIINTEREWEEESSLKRQEFDKEKKMLLNQLKNLSDNIEKEQHKKQELVERLQNELKNVSQESSNTLGQLKDELGVKEESFAKSKESLLAQIDELTKSLEIEQINENELSNMHAAELDSLKEKYDELSKRNERARSELKQDIVQQKENLEIELKELQKTLDVEMNIASAEKKALSHKLENLIMENNQKQKDIKGVLSKKENEYKVINTELKNEIGRIQGEIAKKQQLVEKAKIDAENEIRKLQKSISLNESEFREISNMNETNLRRALQPIQKHILNLKLKIDEYKKTSASELKSKNEEIQTLKVRLALRDELLDKDLQKKEENLSRITQRLQIYLDQVRDRARMQSKEGEDLLKPFLLKVQHLKKQQDFLKDRVEKAKVKQSVFKSKFSTMEKEINILEKNPPGDFFQLERLVKLKEKEIGMLNRELIQRETSLSEEASIAGSSFVENSDFVKQIEKNVLANQDKENK
ncbi:MAG: hypothetical protein ABII27_02095 [bacterium]